jgi:hypothetical protein
MQDKELEQLLREGIAAAKAGHKDQARQLLLRVIALDQEVEAAWLWLSEVVDDPHERQICLENVLALNPSNAAAQSGLRWLEEQGIVSPDPACISPARGHHRAGVRARSGYLLPANSCHTGLPGRDRLLWLSLLRRAGQRRGATM